MSLSLCLWACWSVLAGVVIQVSQPHLWAHALYVWMAVSCGTILALGGVLHAVRLPFRPPLWGERGARIKGVSLCLLLCAWAFGQAGWRASARWEAQLPTALEGQSVWVQGEVVGLPQFTPDGVRFQLRAQRVFDRTREFSLPCEPACTMSLGWYGPLSSPIHAGEHWLLPVKLKAPHGHVNPYGLDYELWLWEQRIMATGYVRASNAAEIESPRQLQAAEKWSMSHWREVAREAVGGTVTQSRTAGLISALLLGDQASIERADWDVFRATGVAHLMAISGLHITGLAWLVGASVGALWRRLRWRGQAWAIWCPVPTAVRWATVLAALGYAAFSGWGIPAQRTVGMLCIVHALALRGRRWPWPLTWSFVAACVLVWDPWAWLQPGFILSFVAVGVLFISGGAARVEPGDTSSNVVSRIHSGVAQLLREQVLMSVCLAPLSLILFHQVSVVGLLANLWAVPWVTLVVTPLCVLGLFVHDGWLGAAWAIEGMQPGLQAMGSWSWAQISLPATPAWVSLAAAVGGVCMAMPWPLAWRIAGACWCLPLLTWQVDRPTHGQFELWAADMGQGHAVLVRTHQHTLLYDTGPSYSRWSDAGQRVIVPLLRALDERLDRVMLSHEDADHSGGLRAVMAMQPQADVLTSVPMAHPMLAQLRVKPCLKGQHWEWDGVRFEVLHPTEFDSRSKPNARSCVLQVRSSNGVRALLVGDIEAEQERQLVASGTVGPSDWLLVPHHGSSTSSTLAFLRAVRPRWAVVQAGYRNRYGHPREDVMQRYAHEGIPVVQTPQCGASIWRSIAPSEMQCERERHPHYWHHVMPPQ